MRLCLTNESLEINKKGDNSRHYEMAAESS